MDQLICRVHSHMLGLVERPYSSRVAVQDISSHDVDTDVFDVVGPVCESTDTFAQDVMLPSDTHRGDYLALRSAGAYGEVMSMTYNCRRLPDSVFSK